ncbi:MAG TPA: cupin domain-containing protein [Geminicoccaceae bacterium]|nr:cupin domain-containing protein [Geminicoccaceae bacterium]
MNQGIRPPAVDPASVPARAGSTYPAAFRGPVEARAKRPLGDALGLTQFGVNLVLLPPGTASSQRHWHAREDEFVYVLEGELTLVTDAGEQTLGPGMAAGFPAGRADGHHLINRGTTPATYLEVGTRSPEDEVTYSDVDMRLKRTPEGRAYTSRRGEPY